MGSVIYDILKKNTQVAPTEEELKFTLEQIAIKKGMTLNSLFESVESATEITSEISVILNLFQQLEFVQN